MNAKHTPGPWKYRQPLADAVRQLPVRTLEVLAERNGAYKPYVADVRSLDVHGADNTEANARLIAAAPDLLAVVKGFAAWEAADSPMSDDDLRELFEQGRDAIAKATEAP